MEIRGEATGQENRPLVLKYFFLSLQTFKLTGAETFFLVRGKRAIKNGTEV
jgi:hypothetical protein